MVTMNMTVVLLDTMMILRRKINMLIMIMIKMILMVMI